MTKNWTISQNRKSQRKQTKMNPYQNKTKIRKRRRMKKKAFQMQNMRGKIVQLCLILKHLTMQLMRQIV